MDAHGETATGDAAIDRGAPVDLGSPGTDIAAGAEVSARSGNVRLPNAATFDPPLADGCTLSTLPGIPARTFVARFAR